ncbi:MAG: hypothetical protein P8X57_08380, partial [Cyclobacteriaceae bacterium]
TGWSMNFGFSMGFFSFNYGYYGRPGGWWGPPAYRPPYRPPYYRPGYPNRRPGGYYGNNRVTIDNSTNININSGNRTNNLYRRRDDAVTRDRDRMANSSQNNIRDRNPAARDRRPNSDRSNVREGNVNTSDLGNRMSNRPTAQPADRSKNNVYTDRSGNVYRQQNNGAWQQRTSSGWDKKAVQPNTRQNLNQQSQMRNRGTTRTNNYQRAATRPARTTPSRGRRGN